VPQADAKDSLRIHGDTGDCHEWHLVKAEFFPRPSRALAHLPTYPVRRCACPGLLSCAPPARVLGQIYGTDIGPMPRRGDKIVAGGKRSAAPGEPTPHMKSPSGAKENYVRLMRV